MNEEEAKLYPSIKQSVRLLFVEDDPNDLSVCLSALQAAGFTASADLARTRQEFTECLQKKSYDLVLADYRLPDWRGTEAVPILQMLGVDIPVILVTGVLGEENVVECLHLGVIDVVFKNRLARLPDAVSRALKEFAYRRESLAARKELARTNELLMAQVEELRHLNVESRLVREMGDLLERCVSVEEAYRVIQPAVERLFVNESGALCMLTPARDLLEPVAAWGIRSGTGGFPAEDCWAMRLGRIHSSSGNESGLVCKHLEQRTGQGCLCVPLVANGESIGLLHLAGGVGASMAMSQRAPEARELLATRVAERIALAIANLKLRESLRVQSTRDSLTGLFNRRYMEESLEREICRAVRQHRPLSTIMLDIDHFKRFNDSCGHEAGDLLLVALSAFIQRRTRKEDIACRYGGEEFALILPEAPLEIAQRRAEDLREEIKHLQVRHRGKILGEITLSLGVASYPEHGDSSAELISIADAALYRAKAKGRDRVVIGESPESNVEARLATHLRRPRPTSV